jgi:citrate lyase gamma subunit
MSKAYVDKISDEIREIYKRYEVAGAFIVVDAEDSEQCMYLCAPWNGNVPDDSTPLGYRIRVSEKALGFVRAAEVMARTVWTYDSLRDFGHQIEAFARQTLRMLKRAGVRYAVAKRAAPKVDFMDMLKHGEKI